MAHAEAAGIVAGARRRKDINAYLNAALLGLKLAHDPKDGRLLGAQSIGSLLI